MGNTIPNIFSNIKIIKMDRDMYGNPI